MPFDPLTGSGTAGAYLRTDPKPGQQTWNQVRLNFDDHEDRIATLEGGPGTGDVVGPASSVNNEIPRFDGVTGKLVQSSGISIPDGESGETLSGTNTGDVSLIGTPDYITESNQVLTLGQIDLSTDVTDRLPLTNLEEAEGAGVVGAGAAGDYERILIGAGLAISGGVLSNTHAIGDDSGTAPSAAKYVVTEAHAELSTERVITAGTNVTLDEDGGAGTLTINVTLPTAGGDSLADYLISGGQVAWSGTGFVFDVSAAVYVIDGVQYTSPADQVTLDAADGTNPRIDVIAVTTLSIAVNITGTAAAAPSEPDVNPTTQLKLALVTVPAGSTEPDDVENTDLFLENAGDPAEWDWTTSGSGFNVNSSNNPRTGTKDIEGTTVSSGSYAQGEIGSGTINPNDFDRLVFYLRSKATWANNRVLRVSWYSSGVVKGTALTIASGYWGFDSSNTADYQLISIPMVQFAVPAGTTVNQLRIADSGGSIGFYIDDLVLQTGGSTGTTISGISQEQADARYTLRSKFGNTGLIDGQYGNDEEYALGACGAAKTVDWDNSNQQYGTLTANCTFTLSNPHNAHRYALVLEQAGAGGYSVAFSGVLWMDGTPPDTTPGATGDVFVITLMRTAADSGKYIGSWGSVS